jgi:hypothetical protein
MIIAIDFDGTCVTHAFPKVGLDIGAIPVLQELVKQGHKLILYTMRSHIKEGTTEPNSLGWNNPSKIELESDVLQDAIDWFNKNNIELYGINENPTQKNWTKSPKVYAELYIDDAALGCPLFFDSVFSNRPYVNWNAVKRELIRQQILK